MFHALLAVIYLAFISLGLPDSMLGSAWPSMYGGFGVPVSYAGIVSMIIAVGTVVSSLQSDRVTRRFGTSRVTAVSVAMTATALLGFSLSGRFWQICLWAVPYGLGAGSVDASLNNYVAMHYTSRHMSWLHCMWGVGAALGPAIMGYALTGGLGWSRGYLIVALLQFALTALLICTLPLWKKGTAQMGGAAQAEQGAPLRLRQVVALPGAKAVMAAFFCYCALEQTTGLWASSYLVLQRGIPAQAAASLGSLFFVGITVGRALSGFLTLRFNDVQMVRMGMGVVLVGVLALLVPGSTLAAQAALLLIGLGCAPIYPCIIHATPENFGAKNSQALIGVQMASAYVGICVMPPLFGLLANHISAGLLPFYLLALLVLMAVMHERLCRQTAH